MVNDWQVINSHTVLQEDEHPWVSKEAHDDACRKRMHYGNYTT